MEDRTGGDSGGGPVHGAAGAAPAGGRPAAPAIVPEALRLRVLGTSVTLIAPIREAAERDLGLRLEFIALDGTAAQRRAALEPGSFDIYDQWFHDIDLIWPTGSLQPVEIARIARWSEINALPTTGRIDPAGRLAPGADPSRRLWVQLDGMLGDHPSDMVSLVPTVHNADGFAVLGREPAPAESWGALLDPAWSGRVVVQSDAAIGTLDMALAMQARGLLEPRDIGNLSLEEIDRFIDILRRYRDAGHFRAFWADEASATEALSGDIPAIGSMWWAGITRLRALGIPVRMVTPAEGYRGWFGGLGLARHLDGRLRDAAHDYINWWLDGPAGAVMARTGAYMANPEAVRPHLSPDEWAFWYEGAPAEGGICDPFGTEVFAPGARREGGGYVERMSRIAVWDTVMQEHNYLVRRWEAALRD